MMVSGGIFMLFICYPKCSTCKKAKKFLTDHQIEFDERHIVEEKLSKDELKALYLKVVYHLKDSLIHQVIFIKKNI